MVTIASNSGHARLLALGSLATGTPCRGSAAGPAPRGQVGMIGAQRVQPRGRHRHRTGQQYVVDELCRAQQVALAQPPAHGRTDRSQFGGVRPDQRRCRDRKLVGLAGSIFNMPPPYGLPTSSAPSRVSELSDASGSRLILSARSSLCRYTPCTELR